MIKYTVKDIVKRAEQLADLENSDFISWKENFDLINEAYRSLYQDTINNGDKYNVAILDQEKYKIENTKIKQFVLPPDFYQLKHIVGKTTKNAYSKRAPTQSENSNNTYDIINDILYIYGTEEVEIMYYKNPQVLYLRADAEEFPLNTLSSYLDDNIYNLIENKRLLLDFNKNEIIALLRNIRDDKKTSTLYYISNDELVSELDISDVDGYFNDDKSTEINSVAITDDYFIYQSFTEIFIYKKSTSEVFNKKLKFDVQYADNIVNAEKVETAKIVEKADIVNVAETQQTVVEMAESVTNSNTVHQTNYVENADEIGTILSVDNVDKLNTANNANTVMNTNVVVNSGAVTTSNIVENATSATNIETAKTVNLAEKIVTSTSADTVSNATNVENADTVSNAMTVDKAAIVNETPSVSNSNRVENTDLVEHAVSVTTIDNVANVGTALSITNFSGTVERADNVETISIAANANMVQNSQMVTQATTVNTAENVTNLVGKIENVVEADTVVKAKRVISAEYFDEVPTTFDYIVIDKESLMSVPNDATNIFIKKIEDLDVEYTLDCGKAENTTGATATQFNNKLSTNIFVD